MGKKDQWREGKKWKKAKNSERIIGEKITRRKTSLWRRSQWTTGKISPYGSSLQWKDSKYAIWLWHQTPKTHKSIYGRKSWAKQGNCFMPAKVINHKAQFWKVNVEQNKTVWGVNRQFKENIDILVWKQLEKDKWRKGCFWRKMRYFEEKQPTARTVKFDH